MVNFCNIYPRKGLSSYFTTNFVSLQAFTDELSKIQVTMSTSSSLCLCLSLLQSIVEEVPAHGRGVGTR